jgi:hypothetical protein
MQKQNIYFTNKKLINWKITELLNGYRCKCKQILYRPVLITLSLGAIIDVNTKGSPSCIKETGVFFMNFQVWVNGIARNINNTNNWSKEKVNDRHTSSVVNEHNLYNLYQGSFSGQKGTGTHA